MGRAGRVGNPFRLTEMGTNRLSDPFMRPILSQLDWDGAAERHVSCGTGPMHELSIMHSALSLALDQAQAAGARRVQVIRLRIGALSGVVPEALQFAFEALAPGTLAEGGQLAIEAIPARFWCGQCRREFQSDDLLADCPDCHEPSGDLRAGRELEVASLEID
jgi:hydrogenase nickel incorporation protein HypA/HybF